MIQYFNKYDFSKGEIQTFKNLYNTTNSIRGFLEKARESEFLKIRKANIFAGIALLGRTANFMLSAKAPDRMGFKVFESIPRSVDFSLRCPIFD